MKVKPQINLSSTSNSVEMENLQCRYACIKACKIHNSTIVVVSKINGIIKVLKFL